VATISVRLTSIAPSVAPSVAPSLASLPPHPTALAVSSVAALAVSELPSREVATTCTECGVAAADLAAPGARIPAPAVAALWATIARRVDDPGLALRAVAHVSPNAYRAIDYVTVAAPTVGAAFRQIGECFPLINDSVQLAFDDRPEGTWIRVAADAPLPEVYVEYVLATICSRIREACGIDATPAEATLVLPKRDETRQHAGMFGRAIRFGAPQSRVLIARRIWVTPLPTSDPDLFATLRAHVRALIAARAPGSAGPVSATRWAIRAQIANGNVSLATVARQLATSTRSLQRRLAAHDVRFQDLLDQVRDEIARSRLTDPTRSLGEVASELGFAQPSSLTRAVRRWAGAAPSELRRRIGSGGQS